MGLFFFYCIDLQALFFSFTFFPPSSLSFPGKVVMVARNVFLSLFSKTPRPFFIPLSLEEGLSFFSQRSALSPL